MHTLLEETAHIPVIVGELCDEAYLRRQVNSPVEQRDLPDFWLPPPNGAGYHSNSLGRVGSERENDKRQTHRGGVACLQR